MWKRENYRFAFKTLLILYRKDAEETLFMEKVCRGDA